MGSRGSDFDNQTVKQITDKIDKLVQPKSNMNADSLMVEHLIGYIEAISRKDHDLTEMMDKHALFMFGEGSTDEKGNVKKASGYWQKLWNNSAGKKSGLPGGNMNSDFREIRKALMGDDITAKDLKKIEKELIKKLPGDVKNVTVSNGEISINYADGSVEVFDKDISLWPY